MPLLRAACPSFESRWQAYVSDPIYDESLLFVHVGEFASHLVDLMVGGMVAEFEVVFDAVERLLVDGDLYVRQAATVGLLEGIQNVSGGKTDPEQFVPYLKPKTARKWQLLNDSWNGDSEAARRLNGRGDR
jgi:hypothetical protein